MEERNPQDLKKLIIVFAVGIPILIVELFRAITPSGSSPQKNIIVETQHLTVEEKIDTNPHISWFEKNFCRGYKKSDFCKYFSDVNHPKHQ